MSNTCEPKAKIKNQKSTLKHIANEATKALVLVLNKKIIQTKIKNMPKIIFFFKKNSGGKQFFIPNAAIKAPATSKTPHVID